jgi:hypothetical protein
LAVVNDARSHASAGESRSERTAQLLRPVPDGFTLTGEMPIVPSESIARREEGRASGARRSGGVGAGERRSGPSEALAARKNRGRTMGDRDGRQLRRRRRQRDGRTTRAGTDAGARVVIVRRGVSGRMGAVAQPGGGGGVVRMAASRCVSRGSRSGGRRTAVHRARLYDPRLPNNEREPDGETGRQCAKPRGSSHA